MCLTAWSSLQKLLIAGQWFFYGSKVKLESHVLDPLIFTVRMLPWLLDRLSKRALITWFNFDPGCKRFYTGHISDYPLNYNQLCHDVKLGALRWIGFHRKFFLSHILELSNRKVTPSQATKNLRNSRSFSYVWLGRNQTLFRCVFRSHYCVQSTLAQNFCKGRGSYVLCKCGKYSWVYPAHMSPTLNRRSALEHFERGNAIEIRNEIMFDFYPGLLHVI